MESSKVQKQPNYNRNICLKKNIFHLLQDYYIHIYPADKVMFQQFYPNLWTNQNL